MTHLLDLFQRRAPVLGIHDLHEIAGTRWMSSVTAMVVTKIVKKPIAIRLPMNCHMAARLGCGIRTTSVIRDAVFFQNFRSLKIG